MKKLLIHARSQVLEWGGVRNCAVGTNQRVPQARARRGV